MEQDNQTTEAPALEQQQVPAVTQEQAQQQVQSKNDYQAHVDLSDLPEDKREAIEARFAHLSRLIKKSERTGEATTREYRSLIEQQAAAIEELRGGMGAVVGHLQTQNFAQTETQLKAQLRVARDAGDIDLEADIQDKLLDVKAQKLAAKTQPQPKSETRQQAFAGTPSAMQIADDAVQEGEITSQDLQVIEGWTKETDTGGQILRPWSVNRGSEQNPDPQYIAGLVEARAVFGNPRFANASIEEKLAEVDKRMGTQRSEGQSVMGGGFTPRQKTGTIRLTPQQERIAIKTKYGANRGAKNNAEFIEHYKKQLETTRKGAR